MAAGEYYSPDGRNLTSHYSPDGMGGLVRRVTERVMHITPVTCGNGMHTQVPVVDPVFHFIDRQRNHGVAGIGDLKIWGTVMETGIPFQEMFANLYVLLPGSSELIHCTLTLVDGDEGPEIEVEALRPTVLESNVLYTCKL